jgi:glycogen synthase
MKVLMFGWEYPPHISGGLGTACYHISRNLSEMDDIDLTVVLPKIYGDEDSSFTRLISAENVEIPATSGCMRTKLHLTAEEAVRLNSAYLSPAQYKKELKTLLDKKLKYNKSFSGANPVKTTFTGKYGETLFEEILSYSDVGEALGKTEDFNVIHAHDWLTFPAGIAAKTISGKPLIAHVHATEYDRCGDRPGNPQILSIEKQGFDAADKIITVSDFTKNILVSRYNVKKNKIETVHNGVSFSMQHPDTRRMSGMKTVTFLGRITMQKGPEYFVRAAGKLLKRAPEVRFVMAGTGEMLQEMIKLVARMNISDRFFFTGFVNADEVRQLFSISDIYVMPSVSEPFGITPLEAASAGVPVIISRQSGVAEVLKYAVKVNYWDTEALADAMYGLLYRRTFSDTVKKRENEEIPFLNWRSSAEKIRKIYYEVA